MHTTYWRVLVGIPAALAITIIVLLLVHVNQVRVISLGMDSYATHSVLFDKTTVGQYITLQGPMKELGAIIVPYTKNAEPADVTVTVYSAEEHTILGQAPIKADTLKDDVFANASFSKPIGKYGQEVFIEFSAPTVTKENMLGVRFNPKANSVRYERTVKKEGSYAIQTSETVPLWLFIKTTITQHAGTSTTIARSLCIALIIALIASEVGWFKSTPKKKQYIRFAFIIILAALSFNVRFDLIQKLGGVSGGDPYNYLYITDSLTKLDNPFANTKRLPGYPLLLVPAFLSQSVDDIDFMRLVQMISAVLVVLILPFLAKTIRIPWSISFPAAALLAMQKDFFWTSTRPEPYSLYALLLALALLLFFNLHKKWVRYIFGLVLGYAAMTRQEGFLVAAILGVASLLWYKRFLPKNATLSKDTLRHLARPYLQAFLPALVLVSPFFINNLVSYGNPLFTPYFEGERLQIVDSWPAFVDSIGATWGVVDSMWRPRWDELDRIPFDDWRLQLWVIIGVLWFFVPNLSKTSHKYLPIGFILIGALLPAYLFWISFESKGNFIELISIIPSALMFTGVLTLLKQGKWKGALFVAVGLSQILIATWFHPFAKHYQQSYPFIVLSLSCGLLCPLFVFGKTTFNIHARAAKVIFTAGVLAPLIFTVMNLHQSIGVAIDKNNATNAWDSVTYRAIQKALKYPGPYGVDQAYLSARLYFGEEGVYFPDEDKPTHQEEQEWLKKHNIKVLVSTTNNNVFSTPEADWQVVNHSKSEGRDEELFEGFTYLLPE